MANFKKGIALALVATTAFTFAPVSTLGVPNAVVAEAAAAKTIDATVTGGNVTYTGAPVTVSGLTPTDTYTVVADNTNSIVTVTGAGITAVGTNNVVTTAYFKTDDTHTAITFKGVTSIKLGFDQNQPGNTLATVTNTATNVPVTSVEVKVADKSQNVFTDAIPTMPAVTAATTAFDASTLPYTVPNAAKDALGQNYLKFDADSVANVKLASGFFTKDWKDAAVAGVVKYEFSSDNAGVLNVVDDDNTDRAAKFELGQAGSANLTVLAKNASDKEVAKATIPVVVEQASTNITKLSFSSVATNGKTVLVNSARVANTDITSTDYFYKDTDKSYKVFANRAAAVADGYDYANAIALDTLVDKTAQLYVVSKTGNVTYSTNNTNVATVDANGLITAVGKGTAKITVSAAQSNTYKLQNAEVTVTVSDASTDYITAKVDGNEVNDTDAPVNIDTASATAANAVKSAQIVPTSAAGNTEFIYSLYKADKATAVAGNGNDDITLTAAGVVTAGTVTSDKTYMVKISTKKNGNIAGGEKWVKVVVNTKPADTLEVEKEITLNLKDKNTYTLAPVAGNKNAVFTYKNDPDGTKGQSAGTITLSSNRIFAQRIGSTRVKVTEVATATTRETSKYVVVNVVSEAEKKASDLKVANSAIVLEAGKTATLGATATNAITYTSSDESVVTVVDGTVTAVKAGTANITVTAAASDKMEAGTITVPVVVTTPAAPVVVAKPAKVTGVKVANVKGAKVKVSFKKVSKAAGY
ncbi:Ig-like domain (group 2), partial [Lachnospiraceae bacterium C10]